MVSISFCMEIMNQQEKKSQANKQTSKQLNERKIQTGQIKLTDGVAKGYLIIELTAIWVQFKCIFWPAKINLFVSIGEQLIKNKNNNIHSIDWQTTLRTDS